MGTLVPPDPHYLTGFLYPTCHGEIISAAVARGTSRHPGERGRNVTLMTPGLRLNRKMSRPFLLSGGFFGRVLRLFRIIYTKSCPPVHSPASVRDFLHAEIVAGSGSRDLPL